MKLRRKILVGVAWPYVNGEPHLGHIAGMNMSADIFARFHRISGNDVVMVSGSDMHGTPTALKAIDENTTPEKIATKYHKIWEQALNDMGFSYDLYTNTHTQEHQDVVHDIFLKLEKKDLLYEQTQSMPFSEKEKLFLSDRFVYGECPYCDENKARGDQCEKCGKTLDPMDLKNIKSIRDNSTPIFKETTHKFIKLSFFEEKLRSWIESRSDWRQNVVNQSLGMIKEGLHDRAITRDIEWGIPVPVSDEKYSSKSIYVWFEAVIGYLSATKSWAKKQGDKNLWKKWWIDPDGETYYFQGKDNIPFHTIIWPAILLGYEELNLPTDVVANEYLNLGGLDFSKSKGHAVWVREFLKSYESEPLRYYLTKIMPETSDSEFTWKGFVESNNNELVATLGNFVHRIFNIINKNYDGIIPDPQSIEKEDEKILDQCKKTLIDISSCIDSRKFRNALNHLMQLARDGNKYIDKKEPWKMVKIDKKLSSTSLWVGCNIISALRTAMYPFLPKTSDKIHNMIFDDSDTLRDGWSVREIPPETKLKNVKTLFIKLDESVIDFENGKFKD